MTPLQAFLLGVVQGLTEFLPVSSSGHLVLGKRLLRVSAEMPVTFEVVLHAGTLLATLVVFRRPVWEIVVFLWRAVVPQGRRGEGAGTHGDGAAAAGSRGPLGRLWSDPAGRLLVLLIVGTIPAAVVGVLFEDWIEGLFSNALLVGVALCATGVVLFATRWVQPRGEGVETLSAGKAVLVGVAQAAAITPGISRSGSTIATALLCGVGRETAARFSFLLSMPAIGGAIVLKLKDIAAAEAEVGWQPLAVGFFTSLVVGYIALRVLLAFVRRGRLHWFAYYCWAIGAAAVAACLFGYL